MLQAHWLLNDDEFIREIALQCGELFVVSCCPVRRAQLEEVKCITVINPYKCRYLGEFSSNSLWIDQWPSLLAPQFSELRLWLLSSFETVYLSQSFSFHNGKQLLKEFLCDELYVPLWQERCPKFLMMKNRNDLMALYRTLDSWNLAGVYLIKKTMQWPNEMKNFIFIPFLFERNSYLYALGHRHKYVICLSTENYSAPLRGITWLIGQRKEILISSDDENKDRRYSHSKGALSGPTCYWDSFTKKWKMFIRFVLRRNGRRQKA